MPTPDSLKQAALDAEDVPWAEKLPVAIWRGAATGTINDRRQAGRYHLLTRWAHSIDPRVDVGMTALPMSTGNATRDADLKAKAKPSVGRSAMLRHRYVVSAEGYDVATNLKWALWSASAVIMPRPTVCSWLMEDHLVPWMHYVPVAPDFSNLTDAVEWCEGVSSAVVCQRIRAAGRTYMEEHGFIDVDADLELGRAVAAAAVKQIGLSGKVQFFQFMTTIGLSGEGGLVFRRARKKEDVARNLSLIWTGVPARFLLWDYWCAKHLQHTPL